MVWLPQMCDNRYGSHGLTTDHYQSLLLLIRSCWRLSYLKPNTITLLHLVVWESCVLNLSCTTSEHCFQKGWTLAVQRLIPFSVLHGFHWRGPGEINKIILFFKFFKLIFVIRECMVMVIVHITVIKMNTEYSCPKRFSNKEMTRK